MHIRWINRIKKMTAADIKAYMDEHGCGAVQAKYDLKQHNPKEKVLQYFDDETNKWVDVPTFFQVSFGESET